MAFYGSWKGGDPSWKLDLDDWARTEVVLRMVGATKSDSGTVCLPPKVDMADVVSSLVGAGGRVRGIEPVRVTLEDFYLERISR